MVSLARLLIVPTLFFAAIEIAAPSVAPTAERLGFFTVSNRNQPGIREMEEIAWILRSDPHRKQVGFVHSGRITDEERYVLEED